MWDWGAGECGIGVRKSVGCKRRLEALVRTDVREVEDDEIEWSALVDLASRLQCCAIDAMDNCGVCSA